MVNEIKKEMKFFPSAGEEYTKGEINKLLATVANKNMEKESYHSLYGYINTTKNYYRSRYKVAEEAKDKKLRKLIRPSDTLISKLKVLKKNKSITSKEYRSYKKLISRLKDHHFQNFKTKYNNNSLEDFVTNSNTLNFISEDKNNLIQKSDPIYLEPYSYNYLGAHFYAPSKNLLGKKIDTFWANLLVIWIMTLLLTVTLYFDALRKLIEKSEVFFKTIGKNFNK